MTFSCPTVSPSPLMKACSTLTTLGVVTSGLQVESPDVTTPRVVNVEHAFIRGEGETVGQEKVINEKGQGAQIGCNAIHAGKRQVPLLGWQGARPGVGEVDAAVGLDYHIIGTIEPPPLEAVRNHGGAAVDLLSG